MALTGRPAGPPRAAFGVGDALLDTSRMEVRNLQGQRRGQAAPGQSRILQRNQMMDEKYLMPKEEARPGSRRRLSLRPTTISSKTRANEALRKLAQIETRILSRKQAPSPVTDAEESDSTASQQPSLPKRRDATSPASSQHPHGTFQKQICKPSTAESDGHSGKGSRFLKKKQLPTEPGSLAVGNVGKVPLLRQKEPARKCDAPDSDEEEMKVLLGSLIESSGEKETNRNREPTHPKASRGGHGKLFSDQTPAQLGVPSPLGVDQSSLQPPRSLPSTSVCPSTRPPMTLDAGDTASCTSSPSVGDALSKSASSKMACIVLASSPSRTEAGSSEEPVSEAAADSLQDFRINILSIDDLVLADGDKSDVERKEEGSGGEWVPGRGSPPVSPTHLEVQRATRCSGSAFQGTAAMTEDEEDLTTESEVSEHPDASSAPVVQSHTVSSACSMETPTALTASPAYSEDFEQSSGPLASEASLDRTLDTLSKFSSSRQTDLLPRRHLSRTEWGRGATRVVKETAVQTLDPAFAYQWSKAGGMAAIGPTLGGAYVDPSPIASHIVSADAIEALTAYSPAVLALNDMLKQQLSLTQQFIETNRHLHVSLLQSLDRDSFHYHTLEETKEYIRCHRPAPLTMEAALQEAREEFQSQQVRLAWAPVHLGINDTLVGTGEAGAL